MVYTPPYDTGPTEEYTCFLKNLKKVFDKEGHVSKQCFKTSVLLQIFFPWKIFFSSGPFTKRDYLLRRRRNIFFVFSNEHLYPR